MLLVIGLFVTQLLLQAMTLALQLADLLLGGLILGITLSQR